MLIEEILKRNSSQDIVHVSNRRGWCVATLLRISHETRHPLLITSATGIPEWISPMDAQKLAVGTCDFTCCQRNHKFGNRIVPCDHGITRGETRFGFVQDRKHETCKNCFIACVNGGFEDLMLMLGSASHWTISNRSFVGTKNIDGHDQRAPWIDRSGVHSCVWCDDK